MVETGKYRIVVLGDSLCLPREGIKWSETWPWLLEAKLKAIDGRFEVVNCGLRARTARTLTESEVMEHILWKQASCVILQVGVVDCAPRIFSRRERRVLSVLPERLRAYLIQMRSKRRSKIIQRNALAKVYTKPHHFQDAIRNFLLKAFEANTNLKIFIVPILYNSSVMDVKSPGFSTNALLYNSILMKCAQACDRITFLSLKEDIGEDCFGDDGYHLNKAGNSAMCQGMLPFLRELPKGQPAL